MVWTRDALPARLKAPDDAVKDEAEKLEDKGWRPSQKTKATEGYAEATEAYDVAKKRTSQSVYQIPVVAFGLDGSTYSVWRLDR